MFENIIGQTEVIGQLKQDVSSGALPSSILLYGGTYTGKQTAALELARVLLCEKKKAAWDCGCSSCSLNRRLNHPAMVLTGPHHFIDEISACADIYTRQHRNVGAFLFIRSLQKLIRRFDSNSFGSNDTTEKKIREILTVLTDGVDLFDPDDGRPDQSILEKRVRECVDKAKALSKEFPHDNLPVQAVRKISSWVHTTGSNDNKVIILENCERMVDSSRNALLKILEEPPKGVYFICITTRKGLIIPTILSRLRQYHFKQRSGEDEKKVLELIFGEKTGEYPDLESYFLAWRNIKTDDLHAYAAQFMELVEGNDADYFPQLIKITEYMNSKDNAQYFLEALSRLIGSRYRNNSRLKPGDIRRYEIWNHAIRQCLAGISLYHQRPSLKIEDLMFTMRKDT